MMFDGIRKQRRRMSSNDLQHVEVTMINGN